jgi:small-conductance mechanosensitive channel
MTKFIQLVLCCLSVCALAQQTGAQQRDVVIDGRSLWTVRAPRAGLNAIERAQDIRESIIEVAEDDRRSLEDLREVHLDTESILVLSRTYIFSVTDEDARLENRARKDLFEERKQVLLAAIARYRGDRQWSNQLRAGGLAAGALVLALLLVIALHALYKAIARRVPVILATRTQAGEHASWYRVFQAPLLLVARISLGIAYGLLALTILTTLTSFALGLFPATMYVSSTVKTQVWMVLGAMAANILSYLPNLIVLVVICVLTYCLLWVTKTVALAVESGAISIKGLHQDWAMSTYSLLKVLLILFALVVAFPYFPGGNSPALKGASIFIGLLVSLGSGSAMGNVIAGVILTYMRPFRVGDRVQIANTTGDVLEKSLLVTRLKTIKNVEVILPNSQVLGAHILNYSAQAQEHGLVLHTTVTFGYDVAWRTVHALMITAALRTQGILPEPQPFVLQTSLNDWHISYELNAYTNAAHRMAELYSELHKHIQEEFNRSGIEMMSPSYLALRDGNTVTMPQENRPKDYQPPSFRVSSEPAVAHKDPPPAVDSEAGVPSPFSLGTPVGQGSEGLLRPKP